MAVVALMQPGDVRLETPCLRGGNRAEQLAGRHCDGAAEHWHLPT